MADNALKGRLVWHDPSPEVEMTRGRERLASWGWGVALVATLLSACGGHIRTVGVTHVAPTAVTSTPLPQAPLAAWQAKGATQVPPASLQRVSLQGIEVVNQTGGAVSDTQATSWALGFLRSRNYELWAVANGQIQFLIRSGLSSDPLVLFRPDFTAIDAAQAAGDRVEWTPHVIRRIVVRPVASRFQATFAGVGFEWTRYALFLDAYGPAYTYWVAPTGARLVKAALAAGAPVPELVGGTFVQDPLMGGLWSYASDWNCADAGTRQTLAPLCNP